MAVTSGIRMGGAIPYPPAITTTSLPDGLQGSPYSASLSAIKGFPPYTFLLVGNTLLSQPTESGIVWSAPQASTAIPVPQNIWQLTFEQADQFTGNGQPVVSTQDVSAKTGFSPNNLSTAQRGFQNAAGSSTGQMEGVTVGAYLNTNDLPVSASDSKLMIAPEFRWILPPFTSLAAPFPFSNSTATLAGAMDLQIPTCAGGNDVFINLNQLFFDPNGVRVTLNVNLFHMNLTNPTLGLSLDAPTSSYIINEPLGIDTLYVTPAQGSSFYTSTPYSGFRHYAWVTTYTQFQAALHALDSAFPGVLTTFDPAQYRLGTTHLNAEVHTLGSPSTIELGWSMKNFSLLASAPAWLALSSSGNLSGTPTGGETDLLTFQVIDSMGVPSAPTSLSLTVAALPLAITTASLPNAAVGASYSLQMAATGGNPPYTWSIQSGKPAWMSISAGGLVTGTPTGVETDTITFSVADTITSVQRTYSLAVQSAGISGPIVHGQATTITGSGFGTRPNYNMGNWTWKGQPYMHYLWCDFSEVTPPTPSGNANTDFINWKSAGLKGMYPTFYDPSGNFGAPRSVALDGSGVASGGPSFGGKYWQRGPNADVGAGQRYGGLTLQISGTPAGVSNVSTSYPGEYVSYKYQATGFETAIGNEKSYRRSYNFTATPIGGPANSALEYIWDLIGSATGISNLPTGGPTWGNPLQSQINGSGLFGCHNQVNCVSQFNRIQMWTDASGNFQQYCNQNPAIVWNNSQIPAGITILPLWFQTYPTPWGNWSNATTFNINDTSTQCLVTWCSESGINAPYNQNVTDVYFDFTPARVEVTDGTHAEPQILTGWSNTQIQFLANQGQLATGAGTANVYDNTNTIIQSFPVTIGAPPVVFDFFISTTGNNANNGLTPATAWAITSFIDTNAHNATMAGKKIGIVGGTYTITGMMSGSHPGSNINNYPWSVLSIPKGPSSAVPTYVASCDASGNYSRGAAKFIYCNSVNTSYNSCWGFAGGNATLDGIEIDAGAGTGTTLGEGPITLNNTVNGAVVGTIVQNCYVHDMASNGGGSNFAMVGTFGAHGALIQNNLFKNVTAPNGQPDHAHGTIEYDGVSNQFFNNTYVSCSSAHDTKSGTVGTEFAYNYITQCAFTGLLGFDGGNNVAGASFNVHNNVLDSNANGILGDINNGNMTHGLNFYSNTVYDTRAGSKNILDLRSSANLIQCYDNLMVSTTGNGGNQSHGLLQLNSGGYTVLNYNGYAFTSLTSACVLGAGLSSTLAAWRTATSAEAASQTASATFTGAITPGAGPTQFKLGGGSAYLSAGKTGGTSGGATVNIGAWDGTVTQIGCSFGPQ